MEIILAQTCQSLTGYLSKKHGYYCAMIKGRCYGRRSHKSAVPENGHWLFISDLAKMAGSPIVENIRVDAPELQKALYEAHHYTASQQVSSNFINGKKSRYNAQDIINLKHTFSL